MSDIRALGHCSNNGVFLKSKIGKGFEIKLMNSLSPQKISTNTPKLTYYLVEDEVFALNDYMMRPFPRRCALNEVKQFINYTFSRARRISECVFDILVRRFQIFKYDVRPKLAIKLGRTAVFVHNFILSRKKLITLSGRIMRRQLVRFTAMEGCRRLDGDEMHDAGVEI